VHPAGVVDYYVIGSPSGPYFKGGLSGGAIWGGRGDRGLRGNGGRARPRQPLNHAGN